MVVVVKLHFVRPEFHVSDSRGQGHKWERNGKQEGIPSCLSFHWEKCVLNVLKVEDERMYITLERKRSGPSK